MRRVIPSYAPRIWPRVLLSPESKLFQPRAAKEIQDNPRKHKRILGNPNPAPRPPRRRLRMLGAYSSPNQKTVASVGMREWAERRSGRPVLPIDGELCQTGTRRRTGYSGNSYIHLSVPLRRVQPSSLGTTGVDKEMMARAPAVRKADRTALRCASVSSSQYRRPKS